MLLPALLLALAQFPALAPAVAPSAPIDSNAILLTVRHGPLPTRSEARVLATPFETLRLRVQVLETDVAILNYLRPQLLPYTATTTSFEVTGTTDLDGELKVAMLTGPLAPGRHLTLQARTDGPFPVLSNLVCTTLLAPNTIGKPQVPQSAPTFLGGLFALADGSIVAAGGASPLVQRWEPLLEAVFPLTTLPFPQTLQASAQLADGTILMLGGIDAAGAPSAAAYLLDPVTGTVTPTGSLQQARLGASAVLLGNGRVLVSGGFHVLDLSDPLAFFAGILGTTELYDPTTGAFLPGPALRERRAFSTSTLLANGQVLVAGGLGVLPIVEIPYVSTTGEIYTPGTNTFGLFPKIFSGGRLLHSATRLANGRIVLAGGLTADLSGVLKSGNLGELVLTTVGTTAVYNPVGGGTFSVGPQLLESRALHSATLVPTSGALLVAGGVSGEIDLPAILTGTIQLPSALATTELYTQVGVLAGPAMAAPRAGHAAILAPADGRVLLLGGTLEVELYQP